MKIFKSVFYGILCGFVVMTLAAPAQANKKEEEALRRIFTDLMVAYDDIAEQNDAMLEREGDIIIEHGGTYYAVTLPHLKYRDDKGVVDIGMVAVNAVPEKNGQWKMTIALPTPIIRYDSDNKPSVTVAIGGQNFTGLWDDNVQYFTVSKAVYRDIIVTHASKPAKLQIPDIMLSYNLTANKDKLWSGPSELVVKGLNFTGAGGVRGSVDNIRIISAMTDYSFAEGQAYEEKMNALLESYEQGELGTSKAHALGFYNLVTDFAAQAWEGFDFHIVAEGLAIHDPASDEGAASDLSLDKVNFGFGMNGFRSGVVSIDYKTGFDGLKITPSPEGFEETTPRYMEIDLRIDKVPFEALVSLGKDRIQNSDAADSQIVSVAALMSLPQILAQAQTDLSINSFNIGNDLYALATNGTFAADQAALLGMVGDIRVTLRGLDNLVEKLQAMISDDTLGALHKAKVQNLLQGLAILQMAGQIEKDDKGEESRVYKLELTQDGKATLNGADMSVFFGNKN